MPTATHYSIFEPRLPHFSHLTWFTGDEALTPEECKILQTAADDAEQGEWESGTVGEDSRVDQSHRKVDVFRLAIHANDDIAVVQEKIINAVRRANDFWWKFNIDHLEYMELLRYGDNGAGYVDHIDWGPFSGATRKLSASVLLSDPESYDGGDLEIRTGSGVGDLHVPPKEQGCIVVFPSFLMHRVTPVTRGERWATTAWFEGPPFR